MDSPEGERSSASISGRGTSAPQQPDPQQVVEEYRYLLDDVPPIDETPKELHTHVSNLLDLLTAAHAMEILYHLFCEGHALRFNELEDATGASPKVLSQRLKELVEAGLVSRQSFDEIPPHVEYEPTPMATELDPAFQFLYGWADRHEIDGRSTR